MKLTFVTKGLPLFLQISNTQYLPMKAVPQAGLELPRTEGRPHPSTPYLLLDELERGSPGVLERQSKEAIVVVVDLKPELQHTSSSAKHNP